MSMRTPLNNALGLGSAKDGTGHWWAQRVSAVALVPLTLWCVFSLLAMGSTDHAAVIAWLRAPVNAILFVVTLASLFYHSNLGVQVVVEDYVHADGLKVMTLVLLKLAHGLLAVAAIFAVLRIALGN